MAITRDKGKNTRILRTLLLPVYRFDWCRAIRKVQNNVANNPTLSPKGSNTVVPTSFAMKTLVGVFLTLRFLNKLLPPSFSKYIFCFVGDFILF